MIPNETMNEIADAIREKTGKSEKIAPVNFAEEIKSISAGGGESASTIEYLDVSGHSKQRTLVMYSVLANTPMGVIPSAGLIEICLNMGGIAVLDQVTKIAVCPTLEVTLNGTLETISSIIEDYDAIPRLTKEEFYTL